MGFTTDGLNAASPRSRRPRMRLTLGAVGAAAMMAALPALSSTAIALHSSATHNNISAMGFRNAAAHAGTSGGNLIDHGGKVLAASNTYVIWWGNSAAWPSDVQSGIGSFFGGLNGTRFLNDGLQYMRGAAISTAYQGARFDSSTPPRKIQPSTLGTEVQKIYGTSLDPNGIYFVMTSSFPGSGGFCAWHSLTTVGSQQIAVAYMPNTNGQAGCDPGNLYGVTGSEGLRSLVNVTSHEYMEAITDALPASSTLAWQDSAGAENGDKCAWTFGGPVTLNNGSVWQLQQEWSNAVTGCVQTI